MDKLELHLTYKEREEFIKPFHAKARDIKGSDYYHCEVKIDGELYTSYVNYFEFFYDGQDLRETYEIIYDLKSFLERPIEEATIIDAPQLPKNIIVAFEYALIKYYIKHSPHHCFFTQDNTVKINLLFQSIKANEVKKGDVIKYKITPTPNIGEVIKNLELMSNKGAIIRLDGNRSLDPDQIESLFYNLSPEVIASIEYFEEPFDTLDKWSHLVCSQDIPQAIDESFKFNERSSIAEDINHIIIKFGVNCSVFEYFQLKKDDRKWQITITSGFEAPKLFNLATHLASRERNAAGLSTFMFFKNGLKLIKDYSKEESIIKAFRLI